MLSFFTAIDKGEIEQVKFYLSKNRTIIDKDFGGHRAIDIVLFTEVVNIDMLKLLLSYKPDLNYKIPFTNDLTPIQAISKSNTLKNKKYIINLLEDNFM